MGPVGFYQSVLVLSGLLLLSNCNSPQTSNRPEVEFDTLNRTHIRFILNSSQQKIIKETGTQCFGLFLIENNVPSKYKVNCIYKLGDDKLMVEPEFELSRGLTYEFQFYEGSDTLRKQFRIPLPTEKTKAGVDKIFPLTNKIPSNILMFHVAFSEPMLEDPKAYKKVRIYDDEGKEKLRVWREKSNWTNKGKHLVLMIHPGKIKQGINYLAEDGDLFIEGKTYTLLVSKTLCDKYNRPLHRDGIKTFIATAPDRKIPLLLYEAKMVIQKNTRNPLNLTFSEPMDYGSMQIGVKVVDAAGTVMKGRIESPDEKNWKYIPEESWSNPPYTLQLNQYAADLAGNHLVRKFEEPDPGKFNKRDILVFPLETK